MSNRKTILEILAKDPATVSDLISATGWMARKVYDTCGDLLCKDYVALSKDVVTGNPLYTITKHGRAYLADPPKIGARKPAPPPTADDCDGLDAEALRADIDESMMVPGLSTARVELEERVIMQASIAELEKLLNEKDEELLKQSALVVDLRAELERNAQDGTKCPQECQPKHSGPVQYAIVTKPELYPTREAAVESSWGDDFSFHELMVVECAVVGKVVAQPVFVPIEAYCDASGV